MYLPDLLRNLVYINPMFSFSVHSLLNNAIFAHIDDGFSVY